MLFWILTWLLGWICVACGIATVGFGLWGEQRERHETDKDFRDKVATSLMISPVFFILAAVLLAVYYLSPPL